MKKMKKSYFVGLWIVILLLSMGIALPMAQAQSAAGPNVVVSPGAAAIDKKSKVTIMGSGFQPGQEISILFQDQYGALSVIKEAKANSRGSWATVWTLGRYTRRGIIKDGVYAIMAADNEYNVLASAPVGFIKQTGSKKKWPDWAKAAKIKVKRAKKKKKQKK